MTTEGVTVKTCRFVSAGLELDAIVRRAADGIVTVEFRRMSGPLQSPIEQLVLHWGAAPSLDSNDYVRPPKDMLPQGTQFRDGKQSVRSNFVEQAGADFPTVIMCVHEKELPPQLLFLAYIEKGRGGCAEQWFKPIDGATSFRLPLLDALSEPEKKRREEEVRAAKENTEKARRAEEERQLREREERERKLQEERTKRDQRKADCERYVAEFEKQFEVSDKHTYDFGDADLIMFAVRPKNQSAEIKCKEPASVQIVTNMTLGGTPLVLHWGLKMDRKRGWTEPPKDCWPPNTNPKDGKAVQTQFVDVAQGVRAVQIKGLPADAVGLLAVLFAPPNKWMNKPSGGDMYITVRDVPPLPGLDKQVSKAAAQMAEGIVEREMEYGSWTLMHRYGHAQDLIHNVCDNDTDCWSELYVWMRFSQLRVLDWQRNYNTQPRQLSHAQMSFVTLLGQKFREMQDQRWNIRMTMSCVGRGGGGDMGQRIRDDILVILRHNNGWGHGSMMEQWHQKLHNNTSPDDVIICNALLAFWHSNGNKAEYWRVLNDNGVTKERMASYEQPITAEPDYPAHLRDTMLHELGRYGHLLKVVHLGTDLDTIVDHCRGFMHGDTRDAVNRYLHDRWHASFIDKLKSVYAARKAVLAQLFRDGVPAEQVRDLLFLDIALESDSRRKVESGESHDGSLYSHLTSLATCTESLALSEDGLETCVRLKNVARDLYEITKKLEFYGESEDVGLRAAASMTMARNTMTQLVDRYKRYFGSMSSCLGNAFHADKDIVDIFVEEAIRGGPAYMLSALLRKAEPAVRRIARLGPWSVIAPLDREATGPVRVFRHLRECMTEHFEKDTIVVADVCDGDEDVPSNAAYVIIGSTVDILSHVAVRARNEHHALIACIDEAEMERLRSYEGSLASAKLEGDNLKLEIKDMSAFTRMRSQESLSMLKKIRSKNLITPPSGMQTPPHAFSGLLRSSQSKLNFAEGDHQLARPMKRSGSILSETHLSAPWAIRPSAFNLDLVGSKSLNLGRLMNLGLPDWIQLPASVTIPNGALKKAFRDEKNKLLRERYSALRTEIYNASPNDVRLCPELKKVIMQLELPDGLAAALRGVLDELECEDIDETLPAAWEAVKGVWASTWNERAHLARRKHDMFTEDVDMAVLCQKIIDADYAFVIHTNNPITGSKDEIYGEIVVGLGETLVGNAPGQALGFIVPKGNLEKPVIKSYPSKQFALRGGKFIFRSDSNSEDLEGFAGAGLHDSIPLEPNKKEEIDYSKEALMLDDELRRKLMVGVGKIGKCIEDTMGGFPQDIEGCYKDGVFYVVQARPQM